MKDSEQNLRKPFCFAKLYDDKGLTKTYFGRKIIINTRNIHTLNLIDNGIIEGGICTLFEQHIKPGGTVIDVGANIGFLTLLAGHLVGPNGQVFAIEANPDVFKTLNENVMINGFAKRVSTHQLAAYDSAKELTFTWNSHRDGSGRIVTPTQARLAEKNCKVQAQALDAICGETQVDLIKIDAEGAEPYVLRGAKNIINNNPEIKVIFEWNAKHIAKRNQNPKEFCQDVFGQFNHVYEIKHKDALAPLTLDELLVLPHANILAHN